MATKQSSNVNGWVILAYTGEQLRWVFGPFTTREEANVPLPLAQQVRQVVVPLWSPAPSIPYPPDRSARDKPRS